MKRICTLIWVSYAALTTCAWVNASAQRPTHFPRPAPTPTPTAAPAPVLVAADVKVEGQKLIEQFKTLKSDVALHKAFIESGSSQVDKLLAVDEYDTAVLLADLVRRSALFVKDPTADDWLKKIADAKKVDAEFDRIKAAIDRVADGTASQEDRAVVGKFYAFFKGDWDKGLTLLAKGNDEQLKALAALDAAAGEDKAKVLEIADKWWDLALKQTGLPQVNIKKHAGDLYRKVYETLAGVDKTRVEKRLLELQGDVSKELIGQWTYDMGRQPMALKFVADGSVLGDKTFNWKGQWTVKVGKIHIDWENPAGRSMDLTLPLNKGGTTVVWPDGRTRGSMKKD